MRLFVKRSVTSLAVVLFAFAGFYAYWMMAPPAQTCASCHEIEGAHERWTQSAHRDVTCTECHGTALSTGLHSLREKARMVTTHLSSERPEVLGLTEAQVLETMARCESCHAREYADWLSSGHSTTYAGIFLDKSHNAQERLTDSCLRCHGMFFEGNVSDLVQPLDVQGPWMLVDAAMASTPTIPCLACQPIHVQGSPAVRPDYANPSTIAALREARVARVGFYDRYEKMHFSAEDLPVLTPSQAGDPVQVSLDVHQRVCVQCHAPNAFHQAGSSDDRTPRGVHEGLSCAACHDAHSNEAAPSCVNCHPRLSNCGLDVAVMNTTALDPASANNIHFVACADCHDQAFLTNHGR